MTGIEDRTGRQVLDAAYFLSVHPSGFGVGVENFGVAPKIHLEESHTVGTVDNRVQYRTDLRAHVAKFFF